MIGELPQALLDLFYPEVRCIGCDEPRQIDPGSPLCERCVQALQELRLRGGRCPHCLSPRRGKEPCQYCLKGGMQNLSAAYSAFHYHGPVQRLVTRLKFQSCLLAIGPLADGMLASLDGSGFDALVPIPLHKDRLRERGFNQAALLGQVVSDALSIPMLDALKRIRGGRPQSSLPHHKRRKNVKDAFIAIGEVSGMKLLLVDDVRTTGSTARACATELIKGGASEVCLLTAAVAPAQLPKGSFSAG